MWVYVQLPALQLDRMQALQPELKGLPAVLYGQQEQRVVQANETAMVMGIQPGCSLSDAWVLADNLAAYPYREAQQRHLLQQLAADLYQVFALISLDFPAGFWLDLKPMRKLYPDIQQSQQQLMLQLAPWQLRYQCGSGVTPLVAKMLAQAGVKNAADVPIHYLPCAPKLIEKLQRLGLHTLGALQAIPRALAGQRMGQELVQWLARIQGEQHESLHYFQPPQWFYQRFCLVAEARSWQALRFPLKRMLQELEHFLEGRQQETRYLQLVLHHRDHEPTRIEIGLAHGGYLANELDNFCQLKIAALKLAAPVLELGLQAKQLHPRSKQHGDLLNSGKKQRKPLPRLLNELQLRLGQARVFAVQTANEWLPEQAWQRAPAGAYLIPAQGAGKNTALAQELGAHPLGRPLWLLPQPQPVQIQQWQLLRGPERHCTPWWQPQPHDMNGIAQGICRDYWLGLNTLGQPGWLFYDYQQQCWWQQGWFS